MTQLPDSLDSDPFKSGKDKPTYSDEDLICESSQIFNQSKVNDFFNLKVSEREKLVSLLKELKSKGRLKTIIKKELIEIKEMFGEERKSPIIESSNAKVFSEEDTLVTTLNITEKILKYFIASKSLHVVPVASGGLGSPK